MKLGEYLEKHDLTQSGFAEKIGADQGLIARYVSGERVPRREIMLRIVEATAGDVMPNDFYGVAPADPQPAPAGREAA